MLHPGHYHCATLGQRQDRPAPRLPLGPLAALLRPALGSGAVQRPDQGPSHDRPGVVVATWHCTSESLASGAIGTYDLDRLASSTSNVSGVRVMRPDVGSTEPYVEAALDMLANGSSWQFDMVGLVAVCLGLLARHKRNIPAFVSTVWNVVWSSHPALTLGPPSIREEFVDAPHWSPAQSLLTCALQTTQYPWEMHWERWLRTVVLDAHHAHPKPPAPRTERLAGIISHGQFCGRSCPESGF